MEDAKEEVRSRLNIEDIIGEYVQLKRAGRNFKGLSPFTGEKTPSFYVSPDKHIWHDFSSNKGGDVFSFIMEVEGMDFRESLEHLAKKAGVDMSMYESGGKDTARRKKRLLEILQLASRYYQHSLLKNPRALEYVFKRRGLTKQTVTEFQVGYAPDHGEALVQFLRKKGFMTGELAQAGLINRFGSDLFRGRMMVPLLDSIGQTIGFTGRIIGDDPNAPKYLNTPATMLYDKGRHVFGLSQAKEAIRTQGYVVVVEGNLDVVSSHQADVRPVVATAGTAMTEHHLKALYRLTPDVRLAFDGDKAGITATERVIPIASSLGVNVTIISLTDGAKDPDELIQKNPDFWINAIKATEPAVDWLFKQYSLREDLSSAAGKRAFTTAALAVVKELQDPVVRDHYERLVATMIGSSIGAVKEKLASLKTTDLKPLKRIAAPRTGEATATFDHVDTLLGLALYMPAIRDVFTDTQPSEFTDVRRQAVVRFVLGHDTPVVDEVPGELQEVDEYAKIIIIRAEKRYEGWSEAESRLEAAKLLRQYKAEHIKEQLEDDIRSAEDKGDVQETERLRQQHYALMKEVKRG